MYLSSFWMYFECYLHANWNEYLHFSWSEKRNSLQIFLYISRVGFWLYYCHIFLHLLGFLYCRHILHTHTSRKREEMRVISMWTLYMAYLEIVTWLQNSHAKGKHMWVRHKTGIYLSGWYNTFTLVRIYYEHLMYYPWR